MIVADQKFNNKMSFGARLSRKDYNDYKRTQHYNGAEPDSFVLERLKGISKGLVCDFGAGQGRNTIPVAQLGHDVIAMEINDAGRMCIAQAAEKAGVKDKVKTVNANLLDDVLIGQKNADFIFMSHISQHFNLEELQKVMENAKQNLKSGCEFVFDALVKKDSYDGEIKDEIQYSQRMKESIGVANFEEKDILGKAKKAGLSLVEHVPFCETGEGRASYERQAQWIKGNCLKWFVFKK